MMEYSNIPGLKNPVSRLVQGTAMIDGSNPAQEFALLDGVLELGCTTFDTAHVYGKGKNERAVGAWVRERGVRDDVVIIAKGAHHNEDRKRVTPYDITADIHDSLARFQFDHLDLYILHRDDPSVPVEGIIDVLNEHQKAGNILAFGASNWQPERIQAANTYAKQSNQTPFVASSPNYSLAEQVKEPWPDCVSISSNNNADARAYYQKTGMPLFTWSSLAGGFFSGRFNRENLNSFDGYFDKLCVECYCYEDNFKRLDRVKEIAEKKGLSIPQVALAFVMSQPLNIHALVGCQTPDEFKANAAAAAMKLSSKELEYLDLKIDVL